VIQIILSNTKEFGKKATLIQEFKARLCKEKFSKVFLPYSRPACAPFAILQTT
jgi:hypothetical protein